MPTTLYDKVLAVIGMLRQSIAQKTGKIDLAPLFSATTRYSEDALVVYDNVLYRCTTAHQGEWNADDFATATVQDILDIKATKTSLAPEYQSNLSYKKYQLAIKDGRLAQCIIPGVGANAVFADTTIYEVMSRVEQEISEGVVLDEVYAAVQNIAPAYVAWKNYAVGDVCTYKGTLYECTTAVFAQDEEPSNEWWSRYWKKTTAEALFVRKNSDASLGSVTIAGEYRTLQIESDGIVTTRLSDGTQNTIRLNVSKSGTVALLSDLAPNYEDLTEGGVAAQFKAGQIVVFGNGLYICTEAHESDIWQDGKWTECTIDSVLDALMESLPEAMRIGWRNFMGNNRFVSSIAIDDSYVDVSATRIFFTPSGLGMNAVDRVRIRNCDSTLGAPGTQLYMHICVSDDESDTSDNANGTVVAIGEVVSPFGVWPAAGIDADYMGVLLSTHVFANPEKRHFLAFDTVQRRVGDKFVNSSYISAGTVVGLKVLSSYKSEDSGCFVAVSDELRCPLFSFLWSEAASRTPMTCCLEEIDANNRQLTGGGVVPVKLPEVASLPDVTEVRLVVAVGTRGPKSILENTDRDIFVPLGGRSTWRLLSEQKYNVFIFRSLGKRLAAQDDKVIFKRLWCVDTAGRNASDDDYSVWTGAVSARCDVADNWSGRAVPDRFTNIRFYGGAYVQIVAGYNRAAIVSVMGPTTLIKAGDTGEFVCDSVIGPGTLQMSGLLLKVGGNQTIETNIRILEGTQGGFATTNAASYYSVKFAGAVVCEPNITLISWDAEYTLDNVIVLGDITITPQNNNNRLIFNHLTVEGTSVLTVNDLAKFSITGVIAVNQGCTLTLPIAVTGDYILSADTYVEAQTSTTKTLAHRI